MFVQTYKNIFGSENTYNRVTTPTITLILLGMNFVITLNTVWNQLSDNKLKNKYVFIDYFKGSNTCGPHFFRQNELLIV